MPRSVAQLTGVLVTAVVAFGTDLDAIWSVPLGVFAGGLALFFVSLSEARDNFRKAPGTLRIDRRGDRRRH
ncbi:MAG TPA: hypothetical protein VJ798_11265 [Rhizomicrobium sp.]|nr:hypothetical protein [Rhizomicrobium sp.]